MKKENKQASSWYTFRLLNFIFHQLLITYNSITLTLILKFLLFLQHLTYHFQVSSSMRFFKNASKTQKKRNHLERVRPNNVRPLIQEKRGGSPKKVNLLISDGHEIKWVSYLCFIDHHRYSRRHHYHHHHWLVWSYMFFLLNSSHQRQLPRLLN